MTNQEEYDARKRGQAHDVRDRLIAELTAERDALKKDAERYRWLRNSKRAYSPSVCAEVVIAVMRTGRVGHPVESFYGDRLDSAIDSVSDLVAKVEAAQIAIDEVVPHLAAKHMWDQAAKLQEVFAANTPAKEGE